MFALLEYGALFDHVPRSVHDSHVAMLAVIAVVYWYRAASMANLIGAATTIGILAVTTVRQFAITATPMALANGWQWIVWGSALLLVAVVISAMKGGAVRFVGVQLARLNEQLRSTKLIQ
jgi:hypothetical protein